MATRLTLPLVNFTGGEVSPLVDARTDLTFYRNACRKMVNFILRPQGAAMYRPGSRVIEEISDSSKRGDLIPFDFSPSQAYQIEVADRKFRFFKDRGRIEVAGVPVELVTPYLQADLFDDEGKGKIRFAQSRDVVYLAHPNYAPRKLSRASHISWSLALVDFVDGPYLDENITATTFAASAVTGAGVIIEASSIDGINGGAGFRLGDVGRLVRIGHPGTKWAATTAYVVGDLRFNQGNVYKVVTAGTSADAGGPTGTGKGIPDGTAVWDFVLSGGTNWGYGLVTAFTDTTHVVVTVKGDFASTAATVSWQLGLWNDVDGWPACVKFFEERVVYGGAGARPTRIDGSKVGGFETFTPGSNADDAFAYDIATDEQNTVRWIAPMRDLVIGTLGAEFRAAGDTDAAAITPTDISVKKQTNLGVANLEPVLIGSSILYWQRQARKLIELAFDFSVGSYDAHDRTVRAEHIARGGIVDHTWQQEPFGILWAARADGVLAGFTYLKEQEVNGWHRHPLGRPAGGEAIVECVSRIPGPEGGTGADQVWMIVRRTLAGVSKRYVEVFEDVAADDGDPFEAFHVDCGLSYDGRQDTTLTFSAATGEGVSFVAGAATFASGDVGKEIRYRAKTIDQVTEEITWANAIAEITSYTDATHVTGNITGGSFPASLSAPARTWGVTVTEISGLDLQGAIADAVVGIADGIPIGPLTITAGTVTLPEKSLIVALGFGYRGLLQPMKLDTSAIGGTALGQIKRIDSAVVRFFRSLGARVGNSIDQLQDLPFRDIAAPSDVAPDVFTGDLEIELASDWQRDGNIVIVQDLPLPCQVTGLFPRVSVSEG